MNKSMSYHVVLIFTLISRICGAPIDDPVISTTLSSTSLPLSSEKETLLADDTNLLEKNEEVGTEESGSTNIKPSDDSVSETTSRIVLEEDIAFIMPKTTISTILSSKSTTTTTVSTSNDDIITVSTTANPILESAITGNSNSDATPIPVSSSTVMKEDLKPIIVNELPSVSFFTAGMPFVLICEARNPDSSDVFFTQPIKYSWNKNGRPFTELNDPTNQIYSESINNGNILFVQPKSPEDEGTYQCVAENQFGKTYSSGAVVMELRRNGSPRALLAPVSSPIEGEPIISSVPENVPDFGLSREPKLVFYVYPSSPQEAEEFEVMLPALDNEDEAVNDEEQVLTDVLEDQDIIDKLISSKEDTVQTESPEVVAEKEKTINDIKNLLPGLLEDTEYEDEDSDDSVSGSEISAQDALEVTESPIEGELEDILNSNPSVELDLRSD